MRVCVFIFLPVLGKCLYLSGQLCVNILRPTPCFLKMFCLRALSFGTIGSSVGRQPDVFSKNQMQNAKLGVSSFGTKVSTNVKTIYWESLLVVIFCC